MVIQIQISDELWEYLNKEKKKRKNFEGGIKRKLKIKTKTKGGLKK